MSRFQLEFGGIDSTVVIYYC